MLLLAVGIGRAQSGVLVTNTTDGNSVWLKWLSETIYTQEPVNVLRREAGSTQWTKLNATPIGRLREIPGLQRGTPQNRRQEMAEELVLKMPFADQQESMVQLFLLTEIFNSNDFSRFLGIFYEDDTAVPGKTYEYKVETVRPNGSTQEIGISESITVGRFPGLAPPAAIRPIPLENATAISWKPEEERYFSVNVYRDTVPNNPAKARKNEVPVVPSKVPNENGLLVYPAYFYGEDSLSNGTTYYYQLTAVDFFARESDRTPELPITPLDVTPPEAITDLRVKETGPKSVRLRWTRVFGRDLAGYRIFRNNTFDTNFSPVSDLLPKGTTSFEDTVEEYGDYAYYVASVDETGNASSSNLGIVTLRDAIPPQIPEGLTATPGTGTITLRWDQVPDSDLDGYLIFRSIRDRRESDFALLNEDMVRGTVYIDTLPRSAKNDFYYRVMAVDRSFNKSKLSESAVTAMPDVVPPNAPAIKNATARTDSVYLKWFPSLNEDVIGYELYRARGDTTSWKLLNSNLLPPGATSYVDLGLQFDTEYTYRLRAQDASGNWSVYSNRWAVSTRKSAASSTLKSISTNYSKRQGAVQVKWDPPKEGTARGYMLYRRPADGTRFTPVSGMLAPGTKIFKDTNVEPDRAYTYQLRVFYEDGRMARTGTDNVQTR